MQLENFIQFIIRHNALLIQSLVGAIVFFVLFLAYRSFLSAKANEGKPTQTSGGANLGDIEETLKKLLEKAGNVPAVGSAQAAAAGPDSAPLIGEIEVLKKKLEERQSEIEKLKSAPAPAGATAADAGLSDQIKELQAKLAEYEIISEDIADLSFYKEENAKLQKQLEEAKASGGSVPAPSAAAPVAPTPVAAAPTPTPPPPEPPPAIEEPTPVVEAAAPSEPTVEPGLEIVPEPMAEPAAAASEPEVPLVTVPLPPPPEPVAAASLPSAIPPKDGEPAPAPEANPEGDAEVMNEFAAAIEQQRLNSDPNAKPAPAASTDGTLGQMDMDRMLAEAAGLEKVKSEGAGNALEGTLDANKLLQEADSMEIVKPEDAKLMGQFENFVKKGGA